MVLRPAWRDPPILALMVSQTTIWAAIFYVFPALVLHWQADFGWTSGQVMGAFSVGLVIQGLGAARLGGLIDRGLAPVSMPAGALLGAACLVGLTWVETLWQFYAIWAVMGVAMGLTLYDSAFALVMRSRDARARGGITAITLVAGFASTIAYPLTAWVGEAAGWRAAVWVMAALVLAVNLPLSRFAATRLEREARAASPAPQTPASMLRAAARPGFWPLALGIALSALGVGIVTSHLLPLMSALGVAGSAAILAASLIGPAQVAGRLALTIAAPDIPARRLSWAALAAMGVAATLLFGAAEVPALVLAFALLHGMGAGVISILRPVVIRETLGQHGFGGVQGAVVRPALFAFAAAPFAGALLADWGGYVPVLVACAVVQLAGAALLARLPAGP